MNLPEAKDIFKRKLVIVGVGNILKADDGVGPVVIDRLRGKTRALLIDAGTAPESYTGRIIKENPDVVLLIDAVHLDREPGQYEILEKDEILKSGLTTHDISPRMLIEYLAAQTGADIYLLGVQPKAMGLGEDLSPEVAQSIEGIEQFIIEGEQTHA